jgi:hypothetical protein
MLLANGQTIQRGSKALVITEYGVGQEIEVIVEDFGIHNDLATVIYTRDNERKWVYLDQVQRVLR